MIRTLSSLTTQNGSVARLQKYPSRLAQPFHSHEKTSITMVIRGLIDEQVGAKRVTAAPLSVVVKPAGVRHADRFGAEACTTLQIVLSPADHQSAIDSCDPLADWCWIHSGESARPFMSLLRSITSSGETDSSGPAEVDDILLDVLAALPCPTRIRRGLPPGWLLQARDALEIESRPIRLIAESVGVHPVQLAREFRNYFGHSPSAHRRHARLRRAAAILSSSRRSLSTAAYDAGYSDQAHMTREFRSVLGETPRNFKGLISQV